MGVEYPFDNHDNNNNYTGKEKRRKNDEEDWINIIEKLEKDFLINQTIKPQGLRNIGSTCYMNSVLQSLYHVIDLSNGLLELLNKKILNKETLKNMPMTAAFLEVVFKLSFMNEKPMSPYLFKKIISKNESFRKFEANDSKTLTLYVLDILNRELNEKKIQIENDKIINPIRNYDAKDAQSIVKLFNENYNTLIGDLFDGLKVTDYICSDCNNSIKNYQIFNIISCSIEKTFRNKYGNDKKIQKNSKVNILDCLKEEENPCIFNGNNQLFCEKCNKLSDGKSVTKICISPKILIFFLDRGVNNRFMVDVDFPEELDANQYLNNGEKKYKLLGVIEHLGQSGEAGHFIANCKHFNGEWLIFSDSSIYSRDDKNKYQTYGIPYLLFYRKED